MSNIKKHIAPEKIYDAEDAVLKHSNDILHNKAITRDELLTEYSSLNKEYARLLKSAKKIIRTSDPTQRKLKRTQEMLQELNATKDKFFSIIAHDLRNPLGSFISTSEVLQTYFNKMTDHEKHEMISILHSSGKHLYELLNNLLTWSRAQTGKITLHIANLNLSILITSVLNLVKLRAESKSIQIIQEMDKKIVVSADDMMISTVIRNLLSNAVKFTHKGGKIFIRTFPKDDFAHIEIEDSGVGMTADTMNKIFRIDTNHSTAGTENERGTGLGLILCKEFAEMHGGRIFVDSEPGTGTKFTLTVPLFDDSKNNLTDNGK